MVDMKPLNFKENVAPPIGTAFPAHAVAIVGLAGRFPGASDLDEFWRNIRGGVESLETFSDADLDAAGVDVRLRSSAGYVRKGTVLEGADLFDAGFFGVSPREAQVLDPQQRIFLECAWEALEHAGHAAGSTSHAVGVYAGASMNTYLLTQILRDPALIAAAGGYQLMLGNDKDFLCTRVSYKLDLRGPSITIQTACSTSLVAVTLACRALARGECDIALAGGVSLSFPQRAGYLYQEGMILSPDAHCRPFDVRAAGTRAGAGCGIVVLKRLSDALADRDTIHAVIRGAAINNDGAGKAGYTAPSVDGQVEAIATAQALAGVDPRDITYVEAHGTGTPLGDPIEIAALTQVFRASTADIGFCRLGSLKANLGHLDAAAGVAGLIKTVLALKHAELPPLVNFTVPNAQLELDSSPFMASASAGTWDSGGRPRRAAVSSFGIGGTNAHLVLEEGPKAVAAPPLRDAHLLLLSAKTPAALESMTANLARHLSFNTGTPLQDVEWTLQVGRRAFAHRRALVVRDAVSAADAFSQPQRPPVFTGTHEGGARPVAFLFSGQGSQYAGMGASLYAGEPVYRDAVDRCAATLEPHLGLDIRRVLLGGADGALINETRLAQPALFVTEYSLAQLWMSWGVQPSAMLGHSIGELVAAHLAGVMSLQDALVVVAARGRLMQALPPGSMAAVHLPAAELKSRLADGVEIAAINAPGLCTISGPGDALAIVLKRLQDSGVDSRALHTSHAFHSSMMDPALAPFTRLLEGIALSAPTVPYISNVTGTWITPQQATSPAYYADHLRRAVSFELGVRMLAADPAVLLLEVGPGNVLTTLARLTLGKDGPKRVLQSIGRPQDERLDPVILREAAAKLWLAGVTLDFAGMHTGAAPRRVPLPTYPFDRKRYWVDTSISLSDALPGANSAPPTYSDRLEDWLFAPMWARDDTPADETTRLNGTWLVLGDTTAFSQEVLRRAREAGATPVLVERGASFERREGGRFAVRPGSAEDIAAVLEDLRRQDIAIGNANRSAGAIHLWGIGSQALDADGVYGALVGLGVGLGSASGTALRVIHVSTNAECLLDETVQLPKSRLAAGPLLVLPTEFPNVRMRGVDLDASTGALDTQAAATAVLAEAAATDLVPQAAWRHGRRWLKRYERITIPADTERLPVKAQGVYVITGALGGMGLTLARWLATRFQARLLLTARSGLPARDQWDAWLANHSSQERTSSAIAAVRAIEADGGEVLVVAADAADEAAMSVALGAARDRWGHIDGVIHAAGVAGSGNLAALKTLEDTRATLGPKVGGLEVLVRLLGETRLDFVALMSSINSVLGAPGTCDYAAANAVLDAFAEGPTRPSGWRHVVSFNWGAWRDVGMAVNLVVPQARQAQWQAFLATAIPPAVGAEAFARGLSSRRRRVIVVSYDLLAEVRKRETEVPAVVAEMIRAVAGTSTAGDLQSRPELSTTYEAPQSELESRLASIWSELLGIEHIGRHDDFFELGGHSLLATRVLARVQDSLNTRLTLREIFDAPTVHRLASRIESAPGAAGKAVDEEREEMEF
jgi:phthiocerol/phenolphthiocerol synthesis type-I polyketide synthase E